jgi:cell division protein FtsB
MTDLSKTPQEELKEKTWQAATRLAIAATLFGSGYTVGYIQYGDAVELRAAVKQKHDRIVDLENERETMSTRMAKLTRDKDISDKELKACKEGGAPK